MTTLQVAKERGDYIKDKGEDYNQKEKIKELI